MTGYMLLLRPLMFWWRHHSAPCFVVTRRALLIDVVLGTWNAGIGGSWIRALGWGADIRAPLPPQAMNLGCCRKFFCCLSCRRLCSVLDASSFLWLLHCTARVPTTVCTALSLAW